MVTRAIAVINESAQLPAGELAQAVAAVQKQVTNDFGPAWGVTATVDAFPTIADKPLESCPVVIRNQVPAAGVHLTDDGDKAFALVRFTPGSDEWRVTLSHEILEMLADPSGSGTVTGPSPTGNGQTVEYLLEVCDPCQGLEPDFRFGYTVNGLEVSDFVLPSYYKAFGSGRYSFAGHVTEPRSLLPGGYFTWRDPISMEWQFTFTDGTSTDTVSLGTDISRPDVHLRGFIDRRVAAHFELLPKRKKRKARRANGAKPPDRSGPYAAAMKAQAEWWKRQIERVVGRSGPAPD